VWLGWAGLSVHLCSITWPMCG